MYPWLILAEEKFGIFRISMKGDRDDKVILSQNTTEILHFEKKRRKTYVVQYIGVVFIELSLTSVENRKHHYSLNITLI